MNLNCLCYDNLSVDGGWVLSWPPAWITTASSTTSNYFTQLWLAWFSYDHQFETTRRICILYCTLSLIDLSKTSQSIFNALLFLKFKKAWVYSIKCMWRILKKHHIHNIFIRPAILWRKALFLSIIRASYLGFNVNMKDLYACVIYFDSFLTLDASKSAGSRIKMIASRILSSHSVVKISEIDSANSPHSDLQHIAVSENRRPVLGWQSMSFLIGKY